MQIHYKISIFGKVQGVGFRVWIRDLAKQINIKGTVANHDDGCVYIEAEGQSDRLSDFIKECKQGPSGAEVVSLDIKEAQLQNFDSFAILMS